MKKIMWYMFAWATLLSTSCNILAITSKEINAVLNEFNNTDWLKKLTYKAYKRDYLDKYKNDRSARPMLRKIKQRYENVKFRDIGVTSILNNITAMARMIAEGIKILVGTGDPDKLANAFNIQVYLMNSRYDKAYNNIFMPIWNMTKDEYYKSFRGPGVSNTDVLYNILSDIKNKNKTNIYTADDFKE